MAIDSHAEYQAKIEELEKKCAYFKTQADELAGVNIKNDAALSTTRMQLKQKEFAFRLLSELLSITGLHEKLDTVIHRTLKTLQTRMRLTNCILFLADADGGLYPRYWIGYSAERGEELAGSAFPDVSMPEGQGAFLLSTREKPLHALEEIFLSRFEARYFICVPVVMMGQIRGMILISRAKETKPFSPPLNGGDVEALQSIAGFLAMVMENHDLYANLEHKVQERTLELMEKSSALQEANTLINDSLNYASNLQLTMMPDTDLTSRFFKGFFALWEPLGIVGGDIYFVYPLEQGCLLFVIDCTGHGIPGAFMTMVAGAAVESITSQHLSDDPGTVLKEFDRFVTHTLKQHHEGSVSDNGMDMGVCKIVPGLDHFIYAGAHLHLHQVRRQETLIIKGDKRSVGYRGDHIKEPFTSHMVRIEPGDTFYLLSDGYQDQVGGPKRFALGRKRLAATLVRASMEPMEKQADMLLRWLLEYQGEEPRRDDVTVVGFQCF
ncbi:MAG: SpoIIE family protein phosphatase [Magnetococcales bacterium]|nr:SpoIIE family protein phosphatase [Magnetococcales bacterium]